MREDVFAETPEGKGTAFGTKVHEFAEAYAGGDVEPSNSDEEHLKAFIDGTEGSLHVETEAYLPLAVDGEGVTLLGIVDLVEVLDDEVRNYDFKTDRGRHAKSEYRKQLSVYYRVLTGQYPDKQVTASLFYTEEGKVAEINPVSEVELGSRIKELSQSI